MKQPLRRSYIPGHVEVKPLVILRNNSVYLTRAALEQIGHPDYVRVDVRDGSVVVKPEPGPGRYGDGVRKLCLIPGEGGWLPAMHPLIRDILGGDVTVAIDYALPMQAEGD